VTDRTKTMTDQHIIDLEAQELLKRLLPRHWVLREYRPDYGLDYAVELFRQQPRKDPDDVAVYETLGEHVFVQLKGTRSLTKRNQRFKDRINVEKAPLVEQGPEEEIEVVVFTLDAPELNTIRRMGPSVPVLLVVADVSTGEVYHICLNDYVDKILVPTGKLGQQKTHTIYIPTALRLDGTDQSLTPMRSYAKRAKLYAAFQRINYQYVEIQWAIQTGAQEEYENAAPMILHFARNLLAHDFWEDCAWWPIVGLYHRMLEHLLRCMEGGCGDVPAEIIERIGQGNADFIRATVVRMGPLEVWRRLAILPRQYEEVNREAWLPTPLSKALSYS
jgi:hypothetical protein